MGEEFRISFLTFQGHLGLSSFLALESGVYDAKGANASVSVVKITQVGRWREGWECEFAFGVGEECRLSFHQSGALRFGALGREF